MVISHRIIESWMMRGCCSAFLSFVVLPFFGGREVHHVFTPRGHHPPSWPPRRCPLAAWRRRRSGRAMWQIDWAKNRTGGVEDVRVDVCNLKVLMNFTSWGKKNIRLKEIWWFQVGSHLLQDQLGIVCQLIHLDILTIIGLQEWQICSICSLSWIVGWK